MPHIPYFEQQGSALLYRNDGETVRVEPWGPDSLRVRAGLLDDLEHGSIALLAPSPPMRTISPFPSWKTVPPCAMARSR